MFDYITYINKYGAPTYDPSIPVYNFSPPRMEELSTVNWFISQFRYGNWAGGGYGAGTASPGPEKPWLMIPVRDQFDAISRTHDYDYFLAYEAYPNKGLEWQERIAEADRNFVDSVLQIKMDSTWGEIIRIAAIAGLGLKSDINQTYVDLGDLGASEVGRAIGSAYGSMIGRAIGDGNPFATVGTSTVVTTAFEALGETTNRIWESALTSGALQGHAAFFFPDVGDIFINQLTQQSAKELSSVLVFKLIDTLGMDGFEGDLLTAAGESIAAEAAGNLFKWAFNGFNGELELLTEFSHANVIGDIGSYLLGKAGTSAAESIIHIDGFQDQLGATIGSIIASYYLPPGIAQFVGTIVGEFVFDQILDDILGIEIDMPAFLEHRPSYYSHVSYDGVKFVETHKSIKDYDASVEKGVIGMRDVYLKAVNELLVEINGPLKQWVFGEAADFGFTHHNEAFSVSMASTGNAYTSVHEIVSMDLDLLIKSALVNDFNKMEFISGDLVKARAFEYWKDQMHGMSDLDQKIGSLAPTLATAKDFRLYMDQTSAINGLMIAAPDTAFTAGWIATLLQAKSMNLDGAYTAFGADGNDIFLTADGDDTINGGGGNDTMQLYGGKDVGFGGYGDDVIYGGYGDDSLGGDWGNDTLYGELDNDSLFGFDGNDKLYGGEGNDSLNGGKGADLLDGGAGDDTVTYNDSDQKIIINLAVAIGSQGLAGDALGDSFVSIENILGSRAGDEIYGSDTDNRFYGGQGNDALYGGKGADSLYGEEGDDFLSGQDDDDIIFGMNGNDTIYGGTGNEQINGGFGNDIVWAEDGDDVFYEEDNEESGNDVVYGGSGKDQIRAGGGNDKVIGGDGEDELYGDTGDDSIYGGAGNDKIEGNAGNDTIFGGRGNDIIKSGDGLNIVNGESGDDVIHGGSGNDHLHGGGGKDKIYAMLGNDQIFGGDDNDFIYADGGDDIANGDAGDDRVSGWKGNDQLYGGEGNDVVLGEDGNDTVYGGAGDDTLYGDRESYSASTVTEQAIIDKVFSTLGIHNYGLLYQGENYTLETLKNAPHDMLIVPMAKSMDVNGKEILWSAEEINAIQSGGGGKMLIGYIDTVRINTFADNWNPDWVNADGTPKAESTWLAAQYDFQTYVANYWDPQWKEIQFDRIDALIEQGFNGVFLDDLGDYYVRRGEEEENWPQAARELRDLIVDLHAHAEEKLTSLGKNSDDFKFIVNGAPMLIYDANNQTYTETPQDTAYYNAVDALLAENFLNPEQRALHPGAGFDAFVEFAKSEFLARDIPVLSIDTDQVTEQQRLELMKLAVAHGFMPFVTENQAYDTLNDPFVAGYNDVYQPSDDVLNGGTGADALHGGEGIDLADYSDAAEGVEADLIKSESNTGEAAGDTYDSIENLIGSRYKDTLQGDNTINSLWGGEGNDMLYGRGGNDTLSGDAGADYLFGGLGKDTADYANAGDGIIANLTNGKNNIGDAKGDFYSSIENIQGSQYDDTLTGDINANTLWGNLGSDLLKGLKGKDVLYGDDGNDILIGGSGADKLYGGAGIDRAQYSDATTGVVADLINTSVNTGDAKGDIYHSIENLHGSSYSDNLRGNNNSNVLWGAAGSDTLYGRNGNDALNGGTGADRLYGGDGADILNGDEGNDRLYGGAGADKLTGGAGSDQFIFEKNSAFLNIDTIMDFNISDKDKINIRNLLENFDPVTQAITDYVQITTRGANSILKVDVDGGGDYFVQIAIIKGVTGLTDENALLTAGNLVV